MVKNPLADARDAEDLGLIPRLGMTPGEGNGNLLWYSCLEKSMEEEPGVLQSWNSKELDTTEHMCACTHTA